MKIYTSGEVAKILNIPYNKLIYMENVGKIEPAFKTGSDKRLYTDDDIKAIKKVLDNE